MAAWTRGRTTCDGSAGWGLGTKADACAARVDHAVCRRLGMADPLRHRLAVEELEDDELMAVRPVA